MQYIQRSLHWSPLPIHTSGWRVTNPRISGLSVELRSYYPKKKRTKDDCENEGWYMTLNAHEAWA